MKRSSRSEMQPFLGCTNYSRDGKGCNNSQTMQAYYSMYGLKDEALDKVTERIKPIQEDPEAENFALKLQQRSSGQNRTAAEHADTTIGKQNEAAMTIDNEQVMPAMPENTSTAARKPSLETIYLNGMKMLDIIGLILQCVTEISEKHFFGTGILLNVLRGSDNQELLKYKLQETSVYGKLACISRENLEIIIDWLISKGFLLQRNSKYPVLHLTYNGAHYQKVITDAELKSLARVLMENDPDNKLSIQGDTSKAEKSYPISNGMRWSEEEDKQLLEEYQSGMKLGAIAKKHNRSNGAIGSRIEKLTGEKNI